MDKDAIEVAYEMAKADAEARAAFERDPFLELEMYCNTGGCYTGCPVGLGALGLPGLSLYRLKPKPKPTYRPYTREELPELVGKAVRQKGSARVRLIVACHDRWVRLGTSRVDYDPSELLEFYTFADGTPCGVRE